MRGSPAVAPPLEAAIDAGRLEIVRLLVQHGARIDTADRPRLICFAKARGADDIARLLAGAGEGGADAPSCEGVALPW